MNGKFLVVLSCLVGALNASTDDVLDHVDDRLTFSSPQGLVQARVSGLVDLEGYDLGQPAPGLIYADGERLVNARLSTFLDAQIGSRTYVFAQARLDRGFDAGDEAHAEWRLDEIALRVSPFAKDAMQVQVGKFATVVGSWVPRHSSWENPFVTAPLPYENQTGIWDSVAADSTSTLLRWAHVQSGGLREGKPEDKERRIPVIWGPSYTNGVAIAGRSAKLEYAFEAKTTALSSRPETWRASEIDLRYPTFSGRIGYRPDMRWNIGVSASSGIYLQKSAEATLPRGSSLRDYRQTVLGQDVSFAWHHFQLWTEVYLCRFEVPRVGNADTAVYYVEAKYKFTPQFSGAVRWNQQFYGTLRDDQNHEVRWGKEVSRIDLAAIYRLTRHLQTKIQYSLQRMGGPAPLSNHLVALQLTMRF